MHNADLAVPTAAYSGSLYDALRIPKNATDTRIRASFAELGFTWLGAPAYQRIGLESRVRAGLLARDLLVDSEFRGAYDAHILNGTAPPILEEYLPSLERVREAITEELITVAHRFALLGQGARKIASALVRRGCDRSDAVELASEVSAAHEAAIDKHSTRLINTGVVVLGVALALNAKILEAVIQHNSSVTIVVYGPILFGIGLIAKGVFQLISRQYED